MRQESHENAFGQFWAARNAVAAYGHLSQSDEEESFETAPSSSTAQTTNFQVRNQSHMYVETLSVNYPPNTGAVRGARKTYVVIYGDTSGRFNNRVEIGPATLVTSRSLNNTDLTGPSGSMATQPSPAVEEQSVEEIIHRIRTTRPVPYSTRLASRLTELEKDVREEELDAEGISARSMQHFIEFLRSSPALRCPAISVTPDRNIYASWKSGRERVFSVHFLPDGKVRFVIFRPNEKHPEETIRISGTATVDVMMSIATPHSVLDWASDERPNNPRF